MNILAWHENLIYGFGGELIKKMSLFMKNLSKFGYPGKSIIVKNKRKYKKLLVKAFQRRFRPELINGKIDQECLLILHNLLSNKA